jgi:hypothetical protein
VFRVNGTVSSARQPVYCASRPALNVVMNSLEYAITPVAITMSPTTSRCASVRDATVSCQSCLHDTHMCICTGSSGVQTSAVFSVIGAVSYSRWPVH